MNKKLYHVEKYMTEEMIETAKQFQSSIKTVSFSAHFKNQCKDKNDYKHYLDEFKIKKIITNIKNNPITPFEIEMTYDSKGRAYLTKYVVRTSYDDTRDVSIVFGVYFNQVTKELDSTRVFIRTAWLNNKTDIHTTLDLSKYSSGK